MSIVNSKAWRLSISDNGTEWKYIGGINSGSFSVDKPVADTTSQTTNADGSLNFTASEHTGYMTATINGSGLVDTSSDNAIKNYKALVTDFFGGFDSVYLKVESPIGAYEGKYNISKLEETQSEADKLKFSISAQNKSEVTFTPTI